MVPSAFLRVYQPLDAFERSEQLHWERFLLHGPAASSRRLAYADHRTVGQARACSRPPTPTRRGAARRRAHVRQPAAHAHARARRDGLVPRGAPDRAVGPVRAEEGRRSEPRRISPGSAGATPRPSRSATRVPGTCRSGGSCCSATRSASSLEDEHGRWRLRYRTTTRRAIRRAEQAIGPLRRSDLGPISDLILDLHQWMVQFDPASILELDYGGLCDFQRWDELDDDHSRSRDPRGAAGAGGRRVPASRRRVPGRADPVGRGARPRDLELIGGQGQNRTADTAVFSRVLCQLSYLARAGREPGRNRHRGHHQRVEV